MNWAHMISGALSALLFVYLLAALFRPDLF